MSRTRRPVSASLLTASSGLRCAALDPVAFAPFVELPRRLEDARWRELAEATGEGEDAVRQATRGDDGAWDVDSGAAADVLVQAALVLSGVESWSTDLELAELGEEVRACGGSPLVVLPFLRPLLALDPGVEPWWLARRFRGSCEVGLVTPRRARDLARGLDDALLTAGGDLDGIPELLGLSSFLGEHASAGRWVVATEWT